MKSYEQLSHEIDENLDKLKQLIYEDINQKFVREMKALDDSLAELRATYK